MVKSNKDYFNLEWTTSLILVIIPVTAWICGAVTRFKEGKTVAAIIRLFFGFNLLWILDIVFMIKDKKIFRILDC